MIHVFPLILTSILLNRIKMFIDNPNLGDRNSPEDWRSM